MSPRCRFAALEPGWAWPAHSAADPRISAVTMQAGG